MSRSSPLRKSVTSASLSPAVAAVTEEIAEEALELIEVDYEVLPGCL